MVGDELVQPLGVEARHVAHHVDAAVGVEIAGLVIVPRDHVLFFGHRFELDHGGGSDDAILKSLVQRHLLYTGSERARRVLENWAAYLPKFVKVMPVEYRRALAEMAQEQAKREQPAARVEVRAND